MNKREQECKLELYSRCMERKWGRLVKQSREFRGRKWKKKTWDIIHERQIVKSWRGKKARLAWGKEHCGKHTGVHLLNIKRQLYREVSEWLKTAMRQCEVVKCQIFPCQVTPFTEGTLTLVSHYILGHVIQVDKSVSSICNTSKWSTQLRSS